ncbi:MAG TPA: hypothetical protein PL077_11040, partial [Treponemataceae bacterium]|nr:hypothetical protein [Treponemataceae bacterium]
TSLPDRPAYIPVSQGLRFGLDPERLFGSVERTVRAAGRDFSIHGEVTSAKEQTVIVRVDDSCKLEFSRSAIASVIVDEKTEKKSKKEKSETSAEAQEIK